MKFARSMLEAYNELAVILLSNVLTRLSVADAHAIVAVRSAGLHNLVIENQRFAFFV
jgi:hypothetical protein